MTKDIYRALSIWNTLRAAFKGPVPLARNLVRKQAHKTLARTMRRHGL
jgi:hypothetical protein